MLKRNNLLKSFKSLGFIKLLFISALSLGLFTQCYLPSDYLNNDSVPGQERLFVKTDTSFIVSAHTIEYDTAYIINFGEIVLGSINNNVFGRTKTSFMSELRLSFKDHDFGDSPTVDSIFLFLRINGYYGNKSIPLTVNVYELSDSIQQDSLYSVFSPVTNMIHPTPIGTTTYHGESFLKVPISNEWANKLLLADSATMATQDSFSKYIYGLYVAAEYLNEPGKAMYYFNYTDVRNSLTLWYTKTQADTAVHVKFDYQFTAFTPRNMRIEHDKSTAVPSQAIIGLNDTITQDSVFYLQGLAGTKGVIKLLDIAAWADSMPIIINRAELQIEPETPSFFEQDSTLTPINIFKMYQKKLIPISDLAFASSTFGGNYSKSRGYYSFNITNHIQDLLLEDSPDVNIYLESRSRYSRASQTILRSGSNSRRIKLIITYTKL